MENGSVVPIHKKGKKDDIENYRPVSLTRLAMKIFEKCIRDLMFKKCRDKISPHQHDFLPDRSCTTQMIDFTNCLALNLNSFFHRTYLKWNDLSQKLREIQSTDSFKSKLKQHLWSIAEETPSTN